MIPTVDTALLKKAPQPGIPKKQDSLDSEHRPTPKYDTTLTITSQLPSQLPHNYLTITSQLPHLHPLKVTRFLKLWDTHKELHTPAIPHISFPIFKAASMMIAPPLLQQFAQTQANKLIMPTSVSLTEASQTY